MWRFGAVVILILIGVVTSKTFLTPSRQVAPASVKRVEVNQSAIDHLSKAITIKTITPEDPAQFSKDAFTAFQDFLRDSYPNVERHLQKEVVNDFSLLYRWEGSDSSLPPYMLLAHLDVVPVESGTEDKWKYPPFDGVVADGFVWGRGAIDNKVNVISILEAAEALLGSQDPNTGTFRPKRTVYFAFGHDEERNGEEGAKRIAMVLKERGVSLEFVLDEGLFILQGSMPGVSAPVAYIGIAEKGYVDLELAVEGHPGHSSIPPRESSVGILSEAIVRLQRDPFPGKIDGAVEEMFHWVAPEMSFPLNVLFINRWLFDPVLRWQLGEIPTTDAMIRTSTAPTMLHGSLKSNVMPARPSAVVNFRILPGENVASVIERVKSTIGDPRVSVSPREGMNDPLPPSRVDTETFAKMNGIIRAIYPQVIVAPSMMLGGTDSKHFVSVSKNIYRFSPMFMTDEDLAGFHGTNEKLGLENYKKIIAFYYNLIDSL